MNYTTGRFVRPVTDTAITETVGTRKGYAVGATRDRVVTTNTDVNTTGGDGRGETETSTCTTGVVERRTTAMTRDLERSTT